MKWFLIAGGTIVVGCIFLLAWSLCVVSKRSDERMEEMRRNAGIGQGDNE